MPFVASVATTTVGNRAKAIAGAANTHGAIGTTTPRKRALRTAGSDRRRPCRAAGASVSGTSRSNDSTTAISTMCGRYGTTRGLGAHCASSPATRGPRQNPAVMATTARRAADASVAAPTGGTEASRSHAVPAPKAAPLLAPASRRPTNSSATLSAPAATTRLASSESAAAGTTTARRPRASDRGPRSNSPGIRPSAYTPNIAVSVPAPTPSVWR